MADLKNGDWKNEYHGKDGRVEKIHADVKQDFSAPDPLKFKTTDTALNLTATDDKTGRINDVMVIHSDGRVDDFGKLDGKDHKSHLSAQAMAAVQEAFKTGQLEKIEGIVHHAEHHQGHQPHHGVAAHAAPETGKGGGQSH